MRIWISVPASEHAPASSGKGLSRCAPRVLISIPAWKVPGNKWANIIIETVIGWLSASLCVEILTDWISLSSSSIVAAFCRNDIAPLVSPLASRICKKISFRYYLPIFKRLQLNYLSFPEKGFRIVWLTLQNVFHRLQGSIVRSNLQLS